MGRQRVRLAVWTVQRSPGEKKKREKEMAKGEFKRTGNAYLGEEQTQGKGEKAFRKGKSTFPENDSRTFLQDKGSDKEFQSQKGTSKDQSRRGKESSCSQSGFSASETPSEEGYGHSWETISILQVQLQEELLHGMARDILHGWRQFL